MTVYKKNKAYISFYRQTIYTGLQSILEVSKNYNSVLRKHRTFHAFLQCLPLWRRQYNLGRRNLLPFSKCMAAVSNAVTYPQKGTESAKYVSTFPLPKSLWFQEDLKQNMPVPSMKQWRTSAFLWTNTDAFPLVWSHALCGVPCFHLRRVSTSKSHGN